VRCAPRQFRGEQRHCDLVAYCHTESVRIVVSIEAKAHEPFGDATVGATMTQARHPLECAFKNPESQCLVVWSFRH